ncbi:MAG TPA: TonB family protein [Steroidobacteraceae bacterium]
MNISPSLQAPAATSPVARTRRTELFVLSIDDGLLLELGPVLGDRFRTRPIEQPNEVAAAAGRPYIVLLDASRRPDARTLLAALETQDTAAPIILITDDDEESHWAASLMRGALCAVVPRSALGSAKFTDALDKAEQRRHAAATAATSQPALGSFGGAGMRRVLPVASALFLAAAAALAWYATHRHPAPAPAAPGAAPAPAAEIAAAPAPVRTRSLLELLSAARIAFRDQKNLLPRPDSDGHGESALELYSGALAVDPQNDEARDGVRRLLSAVRSRVQADLTAGKMDEAVKLVALFKAANVEPDGVHAMESEISATRPKLLVAQANSALAAGNVAEAEQIISQLSASNGDRNAIQQLRTAIDAHRADAALGEQATQVRAAISAGTLLDPAADNARTRFAAMKQMNKSSPLTLAVQKELQLALLSRAADGAKSQQFDVAQHWLTVAADLGNTPELADARRQVQQAIDQRAQAVAAANAAAASEAAAAAAAATPSAPAFLNARLLGPLNVDYPSWALSKKISGFVIIEFTLGTDGKATKPTVIESTPAKTFDAAAIAAVLGGRYDAKPLAPSNQPQRARLRVTFKSP